MGILQIPRQERQRQRHEEQLFPERIFLCIPALGSASVTQQERPAGGQSQRNQRQSMSQRREVHQKRHQRRQPHHQQQTKAHTQPHTVQHRMTRQQQADNRQSAEEIDGKIKCGEHRQASMFLG